MLQASYFCEILGELIWCDTRRIILQLAAEFTSIVHLLRCIMGLKYMNAIKLYITSGFPKMVLGKEKEKKKRIMQSQHIMNNSCVNMQTFNQ